MKHQLPRLEAHEHKLCIHITDEEVVDVESVGENGQVVVYWAENDVARIDVYAQKGKKKSVQTPR